MTILSIDESMERKFIVNNCDKKKKGKKNNFLSKNKRYFSGSIF